MSTCARIMLLTLSFAFLSPAARAGHESMQARPRDSVDAADTWDLTHVYESVDAWEADFGRIEHGIAGYREFEGTLSRSGARLLACLRFDDDVRARLDRLRLYADLRRDIAKDDADCQSRHGRVNALDGRVRTARAFIRPEILAMDESVLRTFLAGNADLAVYEHALMDMVAAGDHTLSQEMETLLARAGTVVDMPRAVFHALGQMDLVFPTVADDDGGEVTVSGSIYEAAKTSPDRGFRERAYRGFFAPYMAHEHTFATLLNGKLNAGIFQADARGYGSAMDASLAPDHIPMSVYRNLVATVGSNLRPLQRWISLKKRVLGLDELHDYDSHVSLFPAAKQTYTYEEAKEIILAALAPLGADYVEDLKRILESRWVDVYPTEGKVHGSYSSGTTFGAHPYVLINWHGQVTELFELVHELGHCMHAHYTLESQPYVYANYAVFASEVASTTNEALLAHYLIDHAETRQDRLARIEQQINNTRLMYYWTTMLAEFEMQIYDRAAAGEVDTSEDYCRLIADLYARYFGPDMTVIPEDTYIWAPLRHLYIVEFYLYQYATSYSAAEQIAARILREPDAAGRYLDFLRSGSSHHPIDALRLAGVDMNSDEPAMAVARRMDGLLDELETLMAEE